MILDTNFLVALERETRRQHAGPATTFLLQSSSQDFCVTPTIEGEMACGVSMANRTAWESLLRPFRRLPITHSVAWHYGEIYRHLAATGNLIGTNDLWIAASGLAHSQAVVTRNVTEFQSVPALSVVTF